MGAASAFCRLLRFYSRLPVPALPGETDPHAPPDFSTAPRLLPFASVVIGAVGAAVLWGAYAIGLGPGVSAVLAIAALVLVTGAFHEDGLADTADGFWGGQSIERRLEIMKDSRIGTYGGAALSLSLLLRAVALAEIVGRAGPTLAVAVVIAAASFSRVSGLLPLTTLPPARPDGAAAGVGRPSMLTFMEALAGAAAVVAVAVLVIGRPGIGLAGGGAALAAAALVTSVAARKIGGQTGDVAGAAQQMAEIAFLLAVVASL